MPGDQTKTRRRVEKKPVDKPDRLSDGDIGQLRLVEELQHNLQQKEKELQEMHERTRLLDELGNKLRENELAMQQLVQQTEEKSLLITELNTRLEEKNAMVISNREQSELIVDLTDKLQELEIRLAASAIQNRHALAQNITKAHMIAGMSLGLLPAPLFDIAALTGTQLNMIRILSHHYQVDFDEKVSKAMITSLVSGSLPVLTLLSLSSIAKILPGVGTIGGGISMTVMAGAVIYATGQVFIRHFESGGTLQDFDSRHWQTFFRQQLDEGKLFVRSKVSNPIGKTDVINA